MIIHLQPSFSLQDYELPIRSLGMSLGVALYTIGMASLFHVGILSKVNCLSSLSCIGSGLTIVSMATFLFTKRDKPFGDLSFLTPTQLINLIESNASRDGLTNRFLDQMSAEDLKHISSKLNPQQISKWPNQYIKKIEETSKQADSSLSVEGLSSLPPENLQVLIQDNYLIEEGYTNPLFERLTLQEFQQILPKMGIMQLSTLPIEYFDHLDFSFLTKEQVSALFPPIFAQLNVPYHEKCLIGTLSRVGFKQFFLSHPKQLATLLPKMDTRQLMLLPPSLSNLSPIELSDDE